MSKTCKTCGIYLDAAGVCLDCREAAVRDSQTANEPTPAADKIAHPPHYTSLPARCECGRPIECIQVTEHMSFVLGNATKYIWRVASGGKDGADKVEDLKKSIFYLEREIQRLSTGGGSSAK